MDMSSEEKIHIHEQFLFCEKKNISVTKVENFYARLQFYNYISKKRNIVMIDELMFLSENTVKVRILKG